MIGALSDWWFRWVGGARVELAGAINGAIPPVPPELGQACQTLSDFVAGLGPFGAIFRGGRSRLPWASGLLVSVSRSRSS